MTDQQQPNQDNRGASNTEFDCAITSATEIPAQTTQPVRAALIHQLTAEFLRVPQVQAVFGIKRGLCYRKINDGTFKSVLLREPGNKTGVRLIHAESVRQYLASLMETSDEGGAQ